MVQDIAILTTAQTKSRIWSIERCHFHRPWTTTNPDFKVTPLLGAEYLRNGTRYRHSFNGIPTGTYTRPTQVCHLEWPWLTLSDLAKYSMTRDVARSLCDSWASVLYCCSGNKHLSRYTDDQKQIPLRLSPGEVTPCPETRNLAIANRSRVGCAYKSNNSK